MRIFRIETAAGTVVFATAAADDSAVAEPSSFVRLEGTFPDFTPTREPVEAARILAPVERPPMVFCIGTNYPEHAGETGIALPRHPVIFAKAPTAVCGPGTPIEIPGNLRSSSVDWEVELAVVIGRTGKNIPMAEALSHVAGYTVANDVSARDWQKHNGGQYVRGKTFDTFCPLGPCIVTTDDIADPQSLGLRCFVNGEQRQNSSTAQMLFSVAHIIAFLSGSTTLLAGTVILTGTPAGVGMGMNPMVFLKPGDVVRCEIDGIGALENPVIDEPPALAYDYKK